MPKKAKKSNRVIAVDIGNTAWKFGLFDLPALTAEQSGLYPYSLDDRRDTDPLFPNLTAWLDGCLLRNNKKECFDWAIAGVNHHRQIQFLDWLSAHRPQDTVRKITVHDIPMANPYAVPEKLGADRLLAAFAASRLIPGTPVLVADIGTAAKCDWVSPNGEFLGGAIFPGPKLAAASLSQGTDLLPDIGSASTKIVPAVDTIGAIFTGIHASIFGGIGYFYQKMKQRYTHQPVRVILTGGYAVGWEMELESFLNAGTAEPERIVQTTRDLVLSGICLTLAPALAKRP